MSDTPRQLPNELDGDYIYRLADHFGIPRQMTRQIRLPEKQSSDWQPIGTAPKDGTHIIGYEPPCMKRGGVIGVFWLKPYKRKFLDMGEVNMGGEWRYSVHDQVVAEPTHWMPLPKVPTS